MAMLDEISFPQLPFDLKSHLFLVARRGSEAHGTYLPSTEPSSIDDRDIQAIVIAPKRNYFGLSNFEHAEQIDAPWDVVVDEFKKFVHLLIKQNPNVLSILWLERTDYLYLHALAEEFLKHREIFSSRLAYKAFCGYADGQLKRMTHVAGRGYLGAKRKQLVEKHGYDTKNAAHLIRLLHMGKEFLATGQLTVKRVWDREMILEIKRGDWGLERVHRYAGQLFGECRDAVKTSPLPPRLNDRKIEDIVMGTLECWFGAGNWGKHA